MSLLILHPQDIEKLESVDQYQAHSCLGLLESKPQIKAPRVTPLEGVSTYALRGIGVRGVENPQGFGIDERRFANMASLFIRTLKPVFAPSAYFEVGLKHAPQRARRTQKEEQSMNAHEQRTLPEGW
ncbi:Uncharacterised protein [uncultured archaeon]|nr:Uncharacterised protein [uncultured archaeon]